MLNIVISLVFVYLLYSLFATILMEVISSVFALRAYNLRKALRTMLTNGEQNYYDEYLAKDSLFKQLSGKLNGKSSPPSYLNPKNFSLMMMEFCVILLCTRSTQSTSVGLRIERTVQLR